MLAGMVAVPVYVLPVSLFGLRALWPRTLRAAASGVVSVGILSLATLGLAGVSRLMRSASEPREMPRLPPLMPEEFAASAASGH